MDILSSRSRKGGHTANGFAARVDQAARRGTHGTPAYRDLHTGGYLFSTYQKVGDDLYRLRGTRRSGCLGGHRRRPIACDAMNEDRSLDG